MTVSNQAYIGTPAGIIVCVDKRNEQEVAGSFYHSYNRNPVLFTNYIELLQQMEMLFDRLNFPVQTTSQRSFVKQEIVYNRLKEPKKVMENDELLCKHGAMGTFIVRVQHRQNSTWQGTITWTDKNKTEYFRSIYEMVRLIGSAIDSVDPVSELPKIEFTTD